MAFFVYMLKCGTGHYYTGYTNDLENRLKQHKQGIGGRFTSSHQPVKLVYVESFKTRPEAMKRERQVKRLPKYKKDGMVNAMSS